MHSCFWIGNCPYYEPCNSCEEVICANTDCIECERQNDEEEEEE